MDTWNLDDGEVDDERPFSAEAVGEDVEYDPCDAGRWEGDRVSGGRK